MSSLFDWTLRRRVPNVPAATVGFVEDSHPFKKKKKKKKKKKNSEKNVKKIIKYEQ